jgi:hypothetical protein
MSIEVALAEITNPGDTLERHKEAESSLAAVNPEIVIAALFDDFMTAKPSSSTPDYMWSALDSAFADAPADWRAWISVNRMWTRAVVRDRQFAGKLFFNKLKESRSPDDDRILIEYLREYWTPDAEKLVAAKMRDPSSPLEVKFAATHCLLRHNFDYFTEVRELTLNIQATDDSLRRLKTKFLRLILSSSSAQFEFRDPDPELIRAGFEHLINLRGDRGYSGDSFAKTLGGYVGTEFEPVFGEPSYSALDGGLDPGIISDNAMRWWRKSELSRN